MGRHESDFEERISGEDEEEIGKCQLLDDDGASKLYCVCLTSILSELHEYLTCISRSLNKRRHDDCVNMAILQYSELTGIRKALHNFNLTGNAPEVRHQTNNTYSSSSNTSSAKDATVHSKSMKVLLEREKVLNAKLRVPFFSAVWEFCGYRHAISGWTFILRTYNVVLGNSPIMELASKGDIVGMQQLFQMRQASPFDVDYQGRTPLYVGRFLASMKLCMLI